MCVVRSCSCPSHSAIVEVSTPAVQQVHRRGVTQRVHRDPLGSQRRARLLRGRDVLGEAPLDRVAGERAAVARGKQRTSPAGRSVSRSQARSTATVCLVSGATRSFRPLPIVRTCAPVPSCVSARVRPSSSETRSPVWTAVSSSAWSRRPAHVDRFGASSSACDLLGGEEGDGALRRRVSPGSRARVGSGRRARGGAARSSERRSGSRRAGCCGCGRCSRARARGAEETRRSSPRRGR